MKKTLKVELKLTQTNRIPKLHCITTICWTNSDNILFNDNCVLSEVELCFETWSKSIKGLFGQRRTTMQKKADQRFPTSNYFSKIPDIQLFSCCKNTKRQTVACCQQPSLMKGVLFHLLLLFVQIYLASKLASSSSIGKRSNAGHLIKTKSGKYFLQLSSKKTKTKTKKYTKEMDNSHNGKVTGKKVTKVKVTGKRGVNKQLPFGQ